MSDLILFEHPLNERIRTLLRLEHLFQQIAFHLPRPEDWDSRAAVSGLLDVINTLSRTDLKSELLKELERHGATLGRIRRTPGVDMERLDTILNDLEDTTRRLSQLDGQFGRQLRENDFLKSIMQRSSIPGGNCAFDLPRYHHWLQRPHTQRLADLQRWHEDLQPIDAAVRLLLALIRGSNNPSQEQAPGGFFQRNLDSQLPVQLIRVGIPRSAGLFAEISGGKHRFTVRFMESSEIDRPVQSTRDVAFLLTCCVL